MIPKKKEKTKPKTPLFGFTLFLCIIVMLTTWITTLFFLALSVIDPVGVWGMYTGTSLILSVITTIGTMFIYFAREFERTFNN